jgi:hypothetical protein
VVEGYFCVCTTRRHRGRATGRCWQNRTLSLKSYILEFLFCVSSLFSWIYPMLKWVTTCYNHGTMNHLNPLSIPNGGRSLAMWPWGQGTWRSSTEPSYWETWPGRPARSERKNMLDGLTGGFTLWLLNCLVVWNMNFIFPFSWEFDHPNWLIFFRGVQTTNQLVIQDCYGKWVNMAHSLRVANLGLEDLHPFRAGKTTIEDGSKPMLPTFRGWTSRTATCFDVR